MPQEACLFRGTVADAIAYARPDVSMDDIEAAARSVGAHDELLERGGVYAGLWAAFIGETEYAA